MHLRVSFQVPLQVETQVGFQVLPLLAELLEYTNKLLINLLCSDKSSFSSCVHKSDNIFLSVHDSICILFKHTKPFLSNFTSLWEIEWLICLPMIILITRIHISLLRYLLLSMYSEPSIINLSSLYVVQISRQEPYPVQRQISYKKLYPGSVQMICLFTPTDYCLHLKTNLLFNCYSWFKNKFGISYCRRLCQMLYYIILYIQFHV